MSDKTPRLCTTSGAVSLEVCSLGELTLYHWTSSYQFTKYQRLFNLEPESAAFLFNFEYALRLDFTMSHNALHATSAAKVLKKSCIIIHILTCWPAVTS